MVVEQPPRASLRGRDGAYRDPFSSAASLPRNNCRSRGVHWIDRQNLTTPERVTTVGNISAVTDAEFEAQVLKSDKPVLVDF